MTPVVIPVRPAARTLNTVSYWSQPDSPDRVRYPLPWLNGIAAPVRRFVTEVMTYPLSRNRNVLPDGGVMTWMYWVFGSVLLIVVYPYAPLFHAPPGIPPYMYPPPSSPLMDSQIGGR